MVSSAARCIHTACMLALVAVIVLISGTHGLQCYNCRGITHYDKNQCFEPKYGKTISQECAVGENCEKKIYRLDRWQEVIERGCSSNCNGRKYIWTSDFRIHCCDDDNLCNKARLAHAPLMFVVFAAAVAYVFAR